MHHFYKLSFSPLVFAALLIAFACQTNALAQALPSSGHSASIEYHFPADGSRYVPSNSVIIIRPSEPLAIQPSDVEVTGSQSGHVDGTMVVSDDGKTLIFTPDEPFEDGEQVNVELKQGIETKAGNDLMPLSFSFEVSPENDFIDHGPFLKDAQNSTEAPHPFQTNGLPPPDFPALNVTTLANPSSGYIFLTTFDYTAFENDTGSHGSFRVILDSAGNPVYYFHAFDSIEFDFQPQPNGQMTFFELPRNRWYAMDSNYNIVDSFWTGAPYNADLHDLELLTHHHALMLSYYPIKNYDLSAYGGSKNATFIGGVIEEIDSLKNPVWIWRSWDPDHFLDTDATHDAVTEQPFDAVHPNAVSVDTDGNLLLSSRELDEVTKISRLDGHLIWRLGGKHNQFRFINDSIHFSHQHAARRIANGDITLFDNGNYDHIATTYDTTILPNIPSPDTLIDTMTAPFSRACEYNVNTNNMTANLVWHYDHDSTVASLAMGYVDRLANGNTLVNWGFYAVGGTGQFLEPAMTEVTPDERVTFEMYIPQPYVVYRAFKFPSRNFDTGFVAPAATSPLGGVATTIPNAGDLTLGAPYPNPSNSNSTVTIGAHPSERISLDLYDPLGRHIASYFSGIAGAPNLSLELSTADIPNGAYELLLHGESGSVSRQMVIVR